MELGTTEFDIVNILPYWLDIQEQDHLQVLGALGILQSNLSEALTCIEAQQWLLNVAKSIMRDGLNGNVSLELKRIIGSNSNKFEKKHHESWKLVSFTYYPHNETIIALALTLKSAVEEVICPLVSLEIFANKSLMVSIEDSKWVHFKGKEYKPVNLRACMEQKGLGYTCTSGIWEEACVSKLFTGDMQL
ncbi:unnamed protein product [Caretta caretta]